MILKVFSVFDSKLQVFNTPFFSRSTADDSRSFSVQFTNVSEAVGNVSWDFGDGSPVSVEANPKLHLS